MLNAQGAKVQERGQPSAKVLEVELGHDALQKQFLKHVDKVSNMCGDLGSLDDARA